MNIQCENFRRNENWNSTLVSWQAISRDSPSLSLIKEPCGIRNASVQNVRRLSSFSYRVPSSHLPKFLPRINFAKRSTSTQGGKRKRPVSCLHLRFLFLFSRVGSLICRSFCGGRREGTPRRRKEQEKKRKEETRRRG